MVCTWLILWGFLQDHSDNPLGAAVTLAHELGHNFGMNHDTPERGCGCRVTVDRGGCIMTPSTGWVTVSILTNRSHYIFGMTDSLLLAAISMIARVLFLLVCPHQPQDIHYRSVLQCFTNDSEMHNRDVRPSLSLHSIQSLLNTGQKSPDCDHT